MSLLTRDIELAFRLTASYSFALFVLFATALLPLTSKNPSIIASVLANRAPLPSLSKRTSEGS
ncbi:hypothetical protein D3C77_671780 [compost metagenome]